MTIRTRLTPVSVAFGVVLVLAACGDEAPEPPISDPPRDARRRRRCTRRGGTRRRRPEATGPDGVLYVGERAGTVHPVTDEGLGDAVADLSAVTTTDGERGCSG